MKLNKFNLSNKTALITGGAGLLGYQHATALLEVSCNVILTDINLSLVNKTCLKLQKLFPKSQIIGKVMDVRKIENIRDISLSLIKEDINIDILINNAAIDPKQNNDTSHKNFSRLEFFSIDQWNIEVEVGLRGPFLCCQVFGNEMAKKGDGGIILNIASDLSVIAPDQRLYHIKGLNKNEQPVKPVTYSVIKSGLIGLTKYVATYWAKEGVRCNALSPGGIQNNQDKEFVKRLNDLIPMGRMAEVDEYKSAIQFLCSDASIYMNGQNIIMDGGRSVL